MFGDPELTRMTLEVLGIMLISSIVGGVISRRRSLAWGVGVGFLVASVLWLVVLYIELTVYARWS
jgi:hypothetical protein